MSGLSATNEADAALWMRAQEHGVVGVMGCEKGIAVFTLVEVDAVDLVAVLVLGAEEGVHGGLLNGNRLSNVEGEGAAVGAASSPCETSEETPGRGSRHGRGQGRRGHNPCAPRLPGDSGSPGAGAVSSLVTRGRAMNEHQNPGSKMEHSNNLATHGNKEGGGAPDVPTVPTGSTQTLSASEVATLLGSLMAGEVVDYTRREQERASRALDRAVQLGNLRAAGQMQLIAADAAMAAADEVKAELSALLLTDLSLCSLCGEQELLEEVEEFDGEMFGFCLRCSPILRASEDARPPKPEEGNRVAQEGADAS